MIDDYDNEDYDYFNEWDLEQAKKEYLKLHLIIKEVREYITDEQDKQSEFNDFHEVFMDNIEISVETILEILDKVKE